ncbi:PUCC protein [Gloeothece citriformis PCC 7424]|uniref:PUCC protein n=1 Tax=Gloeothece citriformis (strain PCC 7424) TaxID=65393 RepID=B7KEU2_GLOC7|nr:BCD family MFS transporter [Gloeothece citriformis]ACK69117.1 PUCC protein [Gloeothece citriformis PCC 7424]
MKDTSKFSPVAPFTIFRLGLFNLGIGLMAVLTLAVLNRVMISELGIPATIAAGTLAMSQLIAPARIWFGQLSDAKPIFGHHRTGYVRLGALVLGIAAFLSVQVVWQLGTVIRDLGQWQWNTQTLGWTALLGGVCAIYGLAVSASSTPFTALLVDISDEENRSKLVAIIWSMLMVGIVIGGITGKKVLSPLEQSEGAIPLDVLQGPINFIFLVVPVIVLAFAFIATWGVEKKYSRYRSRSTVTEREDSITLGRAWKILTASRQTGIFFSFLVMVTLSLFMQEAVLEPYGGDIFGMAVGETTLLNSYWGIGILLGYGTTGFLVVPRLGKTLTTKIGCILVAICFGLIILAGFTSEPMMLKGAMVLFGIAAGATTIGAISLMLDLTAAETAGTFIGAWGLAQAMSRGLATWFGGVILDLGQTWLDNPLWAYSFVFAVEAIISLLAIGVLNQVNIKEFQSNTKQAITQVMEGELDG